LGTDNLPPTLESRCSPPGLHNRHALTLWPDTAIAQIALLSR
jgi:hypothetical protein